MKFWKQLIWPFLSKVFKFIWQIFERTASSLAEKFKNVPKETINSLVEKIKELAQDNSISGDAKMKILKAYAISLLGGLFKEIGQSYLDTFLQILYLDLKDRQIIK